MKLNKTLYEQQFEQADKVQNNQQTKNGEYQPSFSYLADTQFKGQCIEVSQIAVEPHSDFFTIAFYQEQINLNLKSPINDKTNTIVKKVIEIENRNIKNVRLPKRESQKAILIQIKNQIETLVTRLPNEPQTTKTSLYNKKGQLAGFLSYRMREMNSDSPQNQENYEELEEYLSKDKEGSPKNKQQNKQQQIKISQNPDLNSENQFLPQSKQKQAASPGENQQNAPKTKRKVEDDQENSKLQRRALPKMNLSALLKEHKQQKLPQQIKQQTNPQPANSQIHQQQKHIREENKLMAKLREIQNKTLAQKQKMKESQRIKQSNRFKMRTDQSSQEKKSEKDNQSDQGDDLQKIRGSKLYKIPVELKSLEMEQKRNNKGNEKNDKKGISLNFPTDFGGRSFLQKHLKQFTPKNAQRNINKTTNHSVKREDDEKIDEQKKIFRKPGFLTAHKKTIERQPIREFIGLKKRQERQSEVQAVKRDLSQSKRLQSLEKQALQTKSKEKLKLAVSRNIVDIKVNQSVKTKKLTKVINQIYLPKIQQKKEYVQKQIPNPMLDLQQQKKQKQNEKQLKQKHKSKSPENHQPQKQKNTFRNHEEYENQDLKSQYSTPIQPTQYYFDIIVSNLSVNLYSKAFGKKLIEMSSGRQMYTTDSLHGSHLLWVNRGYLFKKVLSSDFLYISLKSEVDNYLKILGKAKINVNELLLNYKQSFYQTYLHSPSDELLAVIIVGYQIFNHLGTQNTSREQSVNIPVTLTPKKTKKLFKGQTKNIAKLPVIVPQQNSIKSQEKGSSQFKKYKGGHNIRMERASRFNTEYTDDEPGPGYYKVISEFDRHTVSRKQR